MSPGFSISFNPEQAPDSPAGSSTGSFDKKHHDLDASRSAFGGYGGLWGLLPQELEILLAPQPAYRSRQIFAWLSRGVSRFDEMLNLPRDLRREFAERFTERAFTSVEAHRTRDEDGTVKLLLKLHDGSTVECVLLTDEEGRKTACLSSQAGCAMGCTFCRTGTIGLQRNLSAAEIVEQYWHLAAVSGPPSHIVFMGMGEPLANADAAARSISIFSHPDGLNLSPRRITISTCGLVSGIEKFSATFPPGTRLAVSLTSAEHELRSTLMPVNRSNTLKDLHRALVGYQRERGKRITLEYVLLGGINDGRTALDALIDFSKDLDCIINLIPWNPGAGLPFAEPDQNSVAGFARGLERAGIRVTRRYRRGRGISGACGQLAGTSA